ncbi:hypothetical protein, variant [Capsaspora owczarzaki ATCC 30864]|uniref:CUB domain-containing protein n=1 Tax=Capsaspora owczarzaki (strain ATCC 30864) TaxID=595528 RepID=E9CI05_CAPO3|nr:hypothetical protein CAOG_07456 [Capsaspora owczarzaki ATCC 30864]XP_011270786.1 hypothetical protein, variant [Capsaspora owczarzaki ATCC 30864]KJE97631.1 hypothetical protein CAOG_007456 [Capsaspora owczarzaki ATCC 30864]KJE97632.1 hypothetical protein, variant 1 [Capsaspora owczarzaki ATCC 30864]KJE97633.1 hypothetical protein, variant 2 [Capsaspora owczarzaki ATCC 30864]|eukprot:XP_004343315.2 hypothetical protein CAOG_07456 [Capsaspora owczarzaki ATCC 30864]
MQMRRWTPTLCPGRMALPLLLLAVLGSLVACVGAQSSTGSSLTPTATVAPRFCEPTTNMTAQCSNRGSCSASGAACVCSAPYFGTRCEYGCDGNLQRYPLVNGTRGFLSDGPGLYSANLNCQFELQLPAGNPDGLVISIRVTQMDLECSWDYLFIFDGPSVRSPMVAALTGQLFATHDFVIRSEAALLTFYSDYGYSLSGYNVSYQASSCPFACSDRGYCEAGRCSCPAGWTGEYCELEVCPNDCSGSGTCFAAARTCVCFPGYTGRDCSVDISAGGFSSLATNTTSLANVPNGRVFHSAVLISPMVYIFGGFSTDFTVTARLLRFRVTDQSWSFITPVTGSAPSGRYSHSAFAVGNAMYIYGGIDATKAYLSELWRYDVTGNSWSLVVPTSGTLQQISGHTTTVSGLKAIVLGGYSPFGYVQTVQEYSFDTNTVATFTPTGFAPIRIFGHSAVLDGSGAIFVYGGSSPDNMLGASASADLYAYWVNDRSWSLLTAGPTPSYFHTAILLPGTTTMAVFGGYVYSYQSPPVCFESDTFTYDTACATWNAQPSGFAGGSAIFGGRFGHATVTLNNGALLMFGGYRGWVLSDVVMLSPAICANFSDPNACQENSGCGWCASTLQCVVVSVTPFCPGTSVRPATATTCAVDGCIFAHSCTTCVSTSSSGVRCRWCSDTATCRSASATSSCAMVSDASSCSAVARTTPVPCASRYECSECNNDATCMWSLPYYGGVTKCSARTSSNPVCPLPCSSLTNCGDCLDVDAGACLWCTSSRTCVASKDYVALNAVGQCQQYQSGSGLYCPVDCESRQSCSSCLAGSGCGWCGLDVATGTGRCTSATSASNCSAQAWYFSQCPACECNGHSTCSASGDCLACANRTGGTHCESCLAGYFGNAQNGGSCSQCTMQFHNITCYSCDSTTGACTNCSDYRSGPTCSSCMPGYYESFYTKQCLPCNCNGHSSSCDTVSGQCQSCDYGYMGSTCGECRNGFVGNARNGGLCFFPMSSNTKYQFTVVFQTIYFVYEPIEDGVDLSFSLTLLPLTPALPDVTVDLWGQTGPDPNTDRIYLLRNRRVNSFILSISDRQFDMSNTVFYFHISTNANINFEVSFMQDPPPLNLIHFFLTFFACFCALLLAAFIVWRIRVRFEHNQFVREITLAFEQMSTRPSASITLWDFCQADGARVVHTKTVPLAIEPFRDGKAAVMTFALEVPAKPGAPRQVCLASALISTSEDLVASAQMDGEEDDGEDPEQVKSESRKLGARVRRRFQRFRHRDDRAAPTTEASRDVPAPAGAESIEMSDLPPRTARDTSE